MANNATFSGSSNRGVQVGQTSGNITVTSTNYYGPAGAEPSETTSIPLLLIPFRRDPDFIERGELFGQIQRKCAKPGSWTALVGIGGVGKSLLAIEYAYRAWKNSPDTWVLWIHASNAARFKKSYEDVAERAKIPGRQDPQANIFELVHNWLDDPRRKWTLILDNLDDARFLCEVRQHGETIRPLQDYIPRNENGSVLITSRDRQAALRLLEQGELISVPPMTKMDAQNLLQKKLGQDCSAADITDLAAALEYMPLAIVQAASYISQRAPRCSVRQYLEQFRESDTQMTSLLDYSGGELRRDREARNSIIITWQISFDHIRHTWPSAADLLSLMSFFDRQGIPESLLRDRAEEPSRQSALDRGFEDNVLILRNYPFIGEGEDKGGFEMHRLVQLASRKWLVANDELERWNRQYIDRLVGAFPIGRFENRGKCQSLFPHARSASMQRPSGRTSLANWALLLYNAGTYASMKGDFVNAEDMAVRSMQARESLFGPNKEATLASIHLLSSIKMAQDQWTEAEELLIQAVSGLGTLLGDEHSDTLTCKSDLALAYMKQGRLTEAEPLQRQVLKITKNVMGASHRETLVSTNNLAYLLGEQGHLAEAEKLDMQVLEARKEVLGVEHPDTLTSMHNLAYSYKLQGRPLEAIELMQDCVRLRTSVLGGEHPDTLISSSTLNDWKSKRPDKSEVASGLRSIIGKAKKVFK